MEDYMPYIWISVIIVMAFAEAITPQLVSIWFVVSAMVAFVISLFVPSIAIQTIVFVLVAFILLLVTRPFVRRMMNFKKEDTNTDRFLNKIGIVIKEIDNNKGFGQVSVLGTIWTAKSFDDSILLEGERVFVTEIEGVKLVVKKINEN